VSRPFWRTTSGIRDGLKGNWMFTFGAITELPDEQDLPFSICVDRSDLQEALLEEIRETEKSPLGATVEMDAAVVKYANRADGAGVDATLADGRVVTADVLVGADGIWSLVRAQMFGEPSGVKGAGSTASFTGYKLFSGLPLFKPYYYEDVGYSGVHRSGSLLRDVPGPSGAACSGTASSRRTLPTPWMSPTLARSWKRL